MFLSILNLLATPILVGITAWYAYSTAKMLREMKRQGNVVHEQSSLVSKSAQIAAWAALINADAHPAGQNPFQQLRKLVEQLERLDGESEANESTGNKKKGRCEKLSL